MVFKDEERWTHCHRPWAAPSAQGGLASPCAMEAGLRSLLSSAWASVAFVLEDLVMYLYLA